MGHIAVFRMLKRILKTDYKFSFFKMSKSVTFFTKKGIYEICLKRKKVNLS